MSTKLDMQNFLKTMNDDEMYICINEVIYTWNGNNWMLISDKYGEAATLAWIKRRVPDSLSRSTARQAWETLKLDLLASSPKVNRHRVLIPCQGAYVSINEDGVITTMLPDRVHHCTYSLACKYDPSATRPMSTLVSELASGSGTVTAR